MRQTHFNYQLNKKMNEKELTRGEKELLIKYSEYLNRFKTSALKKFALGCIEHRDQNPLTLDCDSEIMQEMIDIVSYSFFKTLQVDN